MPTLREVSLLHFLLFCSISLLSIETYAQDDYPMEQSPQRQKKIDFTEEQITAFVNANDKVVKIRKESEQKIAKMLNEEGMDLEQFNKILSAQQKEKQKVKASNRELASFNKVKQEIINERQITDKQIQSSIQNSGLDVATYQQIMVTYQQDYDIKQKIDSIKKDTTKLK